MEPLRIYSLGGLRILQGSSPVILPETRKAEALLVYLAYNRRAYSRDYLANLFWDERSQKQAQSNLRVALASLRKHVGPYLIIERETVELNPDMDVWLDVVEMETSLLKAQSVSADKMAEQVDQLECALRLYGGEFLAGFYLRKSQEFEDWLFRERERLRLLVTGAYNELVEFYLQIGDSQSGLSHVDRLIEIDPLLETAHCQKMRLLMYDGRRHDAIRQFKTLERLFWDELGLEPTEPSQVLYRKIHSGELGVGFSGNTFHNFELDDQGLIEGFNEEYQNDINQKRRLAILAKEWMQAGRDPSFLLRGNRLEQFEDWAESTRLKRTEIEKVYLDASIVERAARKAEEIERQKREAILESRSRRFLQSLVVVLIVSTLIALVLASFAMDRSRLAVRNALTATVAQGKAQLQAATAQSQARVIATQADHSRRAAEVSHSIALAAQSRLARSAGDLDLALSLAIAAVGIEDPPSQSELALSEAAYGPGTVRLFRGDQGPLLSAAISPDGRYALSGAGPSLDSSEKKDFSLRLWELKTGAEIRRMEGHTAAVTRVAFTPDGRQALSASEDRNLILWDINTGTAIRQMAGHGSPILTFALSPDGRFALSASGPWMASGPLEGEDTGLRLWDLSSGEEIRRIEIENDVVLSLAFMPDGQHILTGSYNGKLVLWDLDTAEVARTADGSEAVYSRKEYITALDIDSKGRRAVFATHENTHSLVVWDLVTWGEVQTINAHTWTIPNIDISPDGDLIASSDFANVRVWDMNTGEQVHEFLGHSNGANQAIFTPDSQFLLSASDDGTLRLWSLENGAVMHRFQHSTPVQDVACGSGGQSALSSDREAVHLWDLENGPEIRRIHFDNRPIHSIEIRPDWKFALSIVDEPIQILYWELETGNILQHLDQGAEGHSRALNFLAYSPDGGSAYSTGWEPSFLQWDLQTGKVIHRFDKIASNFGIAISSDGRKALIGGEHTVSLIDLVSGEEIRQLEGHKGSVWSVSFLPGNLTALTASDDKTLILWDIETGNVLHRLIGHQGGIHQVAISQDGQLAISASLDGSLILWDLKTSEAIRHYSASTAELTSTTLCPNELIFLSGGRDGQMIKWRVDRTLDELLAWTRANRYVPELTCVERELYGITPLCTGS